MTMDQERVVQDSVRWLERAVIGLNLCPFAKSVHHKGQIHWRVTGAVEAADLLAELEAELTALAVTDPVVRDTTLLIAPLAYPEFLEFNHFLAHAERLLSGLKLDGMLQIAPFHPRFQFAGTDEGDVTNCTNRSPYPTLHLIREASIDRAVQAFPEAEAIFEGNIATMEKLGSEGWAALDVGPTLDAGDCGKLKR